MIVLFHAWFDPGFPKTAGPRPNASALSERFPRQDHRGPPGRLQDWDAVETELIGGPCGRVATTIPFFGASGRAS